MIRLVFFTTTLFISSAVFSQKIESPDDAYRFLYPESKSNIAFWSKPDSIKAMATKVRGFIPALPKNHIGIFTIRYILFADIHLDGYDLKKAHQNLVLLDRFVESITDINRDFDFFLEAARAYNLLHLTFKKFGDQDQARQAVSTAENFLTNSLSKIDGDSSKYYSAVHALADVTNNIATLLFQTTHYLDPDDKRSETGRLLEAYFDRVDSLFELEDARKSQFIDLKSRVDPYTNMALVYGSYYRNQLKAQKYLEKARELGVSICLDTSDFACIKSGLHFRMVIGWVEFANKNYRSCVEILKPNLLEFEKLSKIYPALGRLHGEYKIDMLYALNESYYYLNLPDSSLYYGERLIKDSTLGIDYVALANASVLMSELYMESDVKRSRELLALSRRLVQLSEAEMVRSKYVAQGEEALLKETENKLATLTQDMTITEARDKSIVRVVAIMSSLVIAFSIFALLKAMQKSRVNRSKPNETETE